MKNSLGIVIDIKIIFSEALSAKFYQGSIVLVVVRPPHIRLVLVKLTRLKNAKS